MSDNADVRGRAVRAVVVLMVPMDGKFGHAAQTQDEQHEEDSDWNSKTSDCDPALSAADINRLMRVEGAAPSQNAPKDQSPHDDGHHAEEDEYEPGEPGDSPRAGAASIEEVLLALASGEQHKSHDG